MTFKSRRELADALRPIYAQVSWNEKQQLLDGFVVATGYNRKHAITVLNKPAQAAQQAARRSRVYDEEVKQALVSVWLASNRICSKRLVPFLPSMVDALERYNLSMAI